MTRKLLISLAPLLAVAAFALAPSAALAGEYGHCVELETSTGRYTNAGCTTTSPSKHGKFEWHAVAAGANIPYASTSGKAELISATGIIKCESDEDAGLITGPKTDTDTVTFTKCTTETAKKEVFNCQNIGTPEHPAPVGIIKTNLLATKLIDHGEKGLSGLEPKEGEVWTEYFVSSGYQAEFECGGEGTGAGTRFRISGSLSGVTTPVNVMTTSLTTTFTATTGEQDLKLEYSEDGGVTWKGPFSSEEITKGTATFAEPIEVKAI